MSWRRAWSPPRLPSVMSRSTTGRRSLALGSVVEICSCFRRAWQRLSNIALRWAEVRLKLRPRRRWRILGSSSPGSIRFFEALGELLDVLGRPVRDFHAEMEPHLRQHLFDLVQ